MKRLKIYSLKRHIDRQTDRLMTDTQTRLKTLPTRIRGW